MEMWTNLCVCIIAHWDYFLGELASRRCAGSLVFAPGDEAYSTDKPPARGSSRVVGR